MILFLAPQADAALDIELVHVIRDALLSNASSNEASESARPILNLSHPLDAIFICQSQPK